MIWKLDAEGGGKNDTRSVYSVEQIPIFYVHSRIISIKEYRELRRERENSSKSGQVHICPQIFSLLLTIVNMDYNIALCVTLVRVPLYICIVRTGYSYVRVRCTRTLYSRTRITSTCSIRRKGTLDTLRTHSQYLHTYEYVLSAFQSVDRPLLIMLIMCEGEVLDTDSVCCTHYTLHSMYVFCNVIYCSSLCTYVLVRQPNLFSF